MIVQNVAATATPPTDLHRGKADLAGPWTCWKGSKPRSASSVVLADADVVKVSVIGVGMRSHAGVARTMFKALADKGINIQVISTSEIKVSVLIAEEYTELALRALHGLRAGR